MAEFCHVIDVFYVFFLQIRPFRSIFGRFGILFLFGALHLLNFGCYPFVHISLG